MTEKVFIFDEIGDRFEVNNIEAMVNEFLDDDLQTYYKSTKYFNELNLAIEELIDKGLMQQVEGQEYDKEGVKLGIKYFAGEIVKRFGRKTLKKLDKEVDLDWKERKPDLSKYDTYGD